MRVRFDFYPTLWVFYIPWPRSRVRTQNPLGKNHIQPKTMGDPIYAFWWHNHLLGGGIGCQYIATVTILLLLFIFHYYWILRNGKQYLICVCVVLFSLRTKASLRYIQSNKHSRLNFHPKCGGSRDIFIPYSAYLCHAQDSLGSL